MSIVIIFNSLYKYFHASLSIYILFLQAIIHIGPHKTASSHIQAVINAERYFLENKNYFQPYVGHRNSPKKYARFASELLHMNTNTAAAAAVVVTSTTSQNKVKQMKNVINKMRSMNQNIIISSEDLSQISIDAMSVLKNDVLHGFDITIIIILRNSLIRAVSYYRYLCSNDPALKATEGFHDFRSFINQTSQVKGYYSSIIQRYASLFGLSNILIIDYYGTIAAQKDIAYTLICQIDSKLCKKKSVSFEGITESYSLVSRGVLHEIYSALQSKGCRIPTTSYEKMLTRITEYINDEDVTEQKIPMTTIHLKDLHDMSMAVDDEIRREYESNIINSDRQASIDAIESLTVDELDVYVFRSSKYWQDWMNTCIFKFIDFRLVSCF